MSALKLLNIAETARLRQAYAVDCVELCAALLAINVSVLMGAFMCTCHVLPVLVFRCC